MKRVLSLVVALSAAALFSSAALAGADCSYHKTQASVDKASVSKDVAAVPAADKADQVQTAQANQQVQAAPATKK